MLTTFFLTTIAAITGIDTGDDAGVRRNLGRLTVLLKPAHLPVRVLIVLSFKHRESGFLYRVSFQYSFNQGHSMDSAIV